VEGGRNMIFDREGHLTENAILSFIKNYSSPAELMEIAEHISTCEKCSLALANSFEQKDLKEVPFGFSEEVQRKAFPPSNGSKYQLFFYSFRVAIAASIALAILFSGTFNRIITADIERIPAPDKTYVDDINATLRNFSQKLLNLEVFNNEKKEK
jgi:hypothetical protein